MTKLCARTPATKTLIAIALLCLACGHDTENSSPRLDEDGDGYTADVDCDDGNATISPAAVEVCDFVDNNCDGAIDDGEAAPTTWYADRDGDGWGAADDVEVACSQPPGFVAVAGDCVDSDDTFHPGAAETDCTDSTDYNCDGATGFVDGDGDGLAACEECDDGNPEHYQLLPGRVDADGDGAGVGQRLSVCSGETIAAGFAFSDLSVTDCDDGNANVWVADVAYADPDGDGFHGGEGLDICRGAQPPEGLSTDLTDAFENDGFRHGYQGFYGLGERWSNPVTAIGPGLAFAFSNQYNNRLSIHDQAGTLTETIVLPAVHEDYYDCYIDPIFGYQCETRTRSRWEEVTSAAYDSNGGLITQIAVNNRNNGLEDSWYVEHRDLGWIVNVGSGTPARMSIDEADNLYTVGYDDGDAVIAKIATVGDAGPEWMFRISAVSVREARAAPNGDVYLLGYFSNGGTVTIGGSDTRTAPLEGDAQFLTKLSSDGEYQWTRFAESSEHLFPSSLSFSPSGSVYLATIFQEDLSVEGVEPLTTGPRSQTLITEWSASGIPTDSWVVDAHAELALDDAGAFYLYDSDGSVTKLDSSKNQLWTISFAGGSVRRLVPTADGTLHAVVRSSDRVADLDFTPWGVDEVNQPGDWLLRF